MSKRVGSWSRETTARLSYLQSREWLATFSSEADAYEYALAHPGSHVEPYQQYLSELHYSVFAMKPRSS